MAGLEDSNVATARPGILPVEDGGVLPTLPTTPPLPSLDQVLPVTIQLQSGLQDLSHLQF